MTTIDPDRTLAETGDAEPERRAKKKHSLAVRWTHWINVPLLGIMIWSGMRIYWADLRDPYGVGIGSWHWFDFWPDTVNENLDLERRLAKGIALHLNVAWFFVANGAAYVLYLSMRHRWRYLVPDRRAVRDAARAVGHDLHLTAKRPPQGKYNPAQQVTYTLVLIMGLLLITSGFAIYKPVQLSFLITLLGGYDFARFIHFSMNIALMAFFVIHILQVARSGWSNFASMITGYQLESKSDDRGAS